MSVIWVKLWADLWDNKVRTLLAVLSIAAGTFAVGAVFGMADQLLAGMDTAHQAVNPSHATLFLEKRIDRDTADRLKTIPGLRGVEVSNQLFVRYKTDPAAEWEPGLLVMRDDYDAMDYDLLELKTGDWPKRNKIGIDRSASDFFGIGLGDKVGSDRPRFGSDRQNSPPVCTAPGLWRRGPLFCRCPGLGALRRAGGRVQPTVDPG